MSDHNKETFQQAEIPQKEDQEISIEDELFGKLILNKNFQHFEGKFKTDDGEINLYLDVDPNAPETWTKTLAAYKKVFSEYDKWDKAMLAFVAKELTGYANDWKDDDEEQDGTPPITEKDFAQRINLCEFSINSKGNFSGFYDDDDMFWGHTVLVEGSLANGFDRAYIAG